jgi:MoaA/NifB/PqqE/SkfB family radical SAM enzyme
MNFKNFLQNYNKIYLKFFVRSLLKRSTPFFGLIFQVTNKCNSRCVTCFNWKVLNRELDKELSLEEIDKFSKSFGRINNITIGGGEPFLREDLSEIIKCFARNNNPSVIAIPTNCLSGDIIVSRVREILESFKGTLKIGLSLDGIGQDHDRIRGVGGNFDKFLETYRKLSRLKEKYPKLRLRICTTVLNLNIDKIIDLIDYIKNNLPMINSYGLELLRGDYDQSKVSGASIDKISRVFKTIEENEDKDNFNEKVINPIYRKILLDILSQKKQVIPCRISAFLPVVDPVGNVYPCENRPKIGNLRDFNYDLVKIWQSKEAKKARKSVREKECYCVHSCYQNPNIYLSLKTIFKIITRKY